MKCPKCGFENDDNWPLDINGEIKEGGCQDCWESACSESWWEYVEKINKDGGLNEQQPDKRL
jgi:hypothetical protein